MLRIAGDGEQPLIACAVILGGGLKPPPLAERSGRPVLDLLVGPGTTVLDHWLHHLNDLPGGFPSECCVVCSRNAPAPTISPDWEPRIRLHRDEDDFRGPAGSVRDAVEPLGADERVLVIEGNRFASGSLAALVSDFEESRPQISVAHNSDMTPAGVYVLRRGTLDLVPPRGFMDLKEQWLGLAVRAGLSVRAFGLDSDPSFAVRTLPDLLRAAGVGRGMGPSGTDKIEGGSSSLLDASVMLGQRPRWESVVSPEADVGLSAVVTESIVMPDATIGEGALVARSLVMPGARIDPGAEVLDDIVPGGENRSPMDPASGREASSVRG